MFELAYVNDAGSAPHTPNRSAWTRSGEIAINSQTRTVTECHRRIAFIWPVNDGYAVAKREWLMGLWLFDGHAGTHE